MKKFEWRALTSLFILFSFLIIIISGLILYIAPPGRIANWTYVPLLGLEKDQWQTIHTNFTFLFIIASGFHLYFNWRFFINHLHNRFTKKFLQRKEILFSIVITIIIFMLCTLQLPPTSTVMAFGDSVKDSWENEYQNPPVPHTEEMSLRDIAEMVNEDTDSVLYKLQSTNNHSVDPDMKLKDLAVQRKQSPKQIFDMIHPDHPGNQNRKNSFSGRGRGRKTMSEICGDEQVDLTKAIKNLQSAGIHANENSRLKDIALKYNKRPSEIIDIMKK